MPRLTRPGTFRPDSSCRHWPKFFLDELFQTWLAAVFAHHSIGNQNSNLKMRHRGRTRAVIPPFLRPSAAAGFYRRGIWQNPPCSPRSARATTVDIRPIRSASATTSSCRSRSNRGRVSAEDAPSYGGGLAGGKMTNTLRQSAPRVRLQTPVSRARLSSYD